MPIIQDNNKRIAKNTLFLYIRMLITLMLGLFTSRITLQALGIEDLGLLSVVGGIITMFDYVNVQFSTGSSRFLTVALGRGDMSELKKTFSACISLHCFIALITLIGAETIGLWFVNNKLVIAPDRIFAANWVYQLSVFSLILGIIQTPYSASVVSHEKMSVFAFMTIYDVVMKLISVCLLLYVDVDKLILYSTFYFFVGLTSIIMYRVYCVRQFEECRFKFGYYKQLYKEIWNYIGWNTIGSFAFMANSQGMTILLNLFFGTAVNGARGIAFTVSSYVEKFVANFQMAVSPQVIKYCAQGNYSDMNRLVSNNAKYSSYLILLIGLPVFIETDYLIYLWLGQVPEYVVDFIRLTLIQMMIRTMDSPIGRGIHAFGKMKLPNLTSSFLYLSILPICYVFLKMGASPIIAYLIGIMVYPLALIPDLWILNKYSGFPILPYLKNVCLRLICILTLSAIIPTLIHVNMEYGLLRFLFTCGTAVLFSSLFIYTIGLSASIKLKIKTTILQKLHIK